MFGIKLYPGFEYDQWPIQTTGELLFIVQMCVVHERPGTWRRKSNPEGLTWPYLGSDVLAACAPTRHPVVIAFQFHAVPMNRGRFVELIHDSDFDWPAALQYEWRTRHGQFLRKQPVILLYLIAEPGWKTVGGWAFAHPEPELACSTVCGTGGRLPVTVIPSTIPAM